MVQKNYVLGRGRVYLARVDPVTKEPGAYRYVGASREFNLTSESENLDHVSSDEGINQVDAQVQLSVSRSGSLILEDINAANLSLFFLGVQGSGAQAAAAGLSDVVTGSRLSQILEDGYSEDHEIIIGATASDPRGARKVSADPALAGKDSDTPAVAVVLAKGVDWEVVDNDRAAIRLLDTAKTYQAVGDKVLSEITISHDRAAIEDAGQMISGDASFEGALRLVENNPEGRNGLWVLPLITLSPNGDLALKSETWRQIPISVSVQKPSAAEAIYYNGVPA